MLNEQSSPKGKDTHWNGCYRSHKSRYPISQISVNASILTESGGTCVCSTNDGCTDDPACNTCLSEIQRDFITTTASVSALASVLMGALANLPVGMAPGLGLNAYVSPPSKYHRL